MGFPYPSGLSPDTVANNISTSPIPAPTGTDAPVSPEENLLTEQPKKELPDTSPSGANTEGE